MINFLLGGKKKDKLPKTAQAGAPVSVVGESTSQPSGGPKIPDGQSVPTQNIEENKAEENETSLVKDVTDEKTPEEEQKPMPGVKQPTPTGPVADSQPAGIQDSSKKKSITEVITKIHDELSETNKRVTELVTDVKNVENTVSSLGHKIDDLEEAKKVSDEKLSDIDSSMAKFLSLYELINNQYNPFVENSEEGKAKQPIVLGAQGESLGAQSSEGDSKEGKPLEIPPINGVAESADTATQGKGNSNLDSMLLELDTLDIEEAAGDAVPLTVLKNNTNSLVIILSWLEYLIKRVGVDQTRSSLRYYTEVLKWITPEVFFDLDKYLQGMKDKENTTEGERLGVKDHIVSLYFISKLNEKNLDEKLTRAVLQIIKE